MASKRAGKQARRGARKKGGSTSTASQGLVLRVIKNDPECEWLTGIVQQLGEKFFDVESFADLDTQQRIGWIRFNKAIARIGKSVARKEGDFHSFLGFLERVAEDEENPDLVQIEAEIDELDPEEQRKQALHQARLRDLQAWRDNQRTLIRLIVFSVLFTATMIAFGVVSEKAVFFGGAGLGAGMTIGLIKAVFSGDMNPFSYPWRSASAPEDK